MTDLLLLVLLRLVTKNMDLLALAVLNDIGSNGSALNVGSAAGERIALNCKNLIKGYGFAFVDVELFYEKNVTLGDLVLLSAGFDNCKHEKHLTFIKRYHTADSLIRASRSFSRPVNHAANNIITQRIPFCQGLSFAFVA